MSWLNLNQSLNSLKGQITNFASEVLSEGAQQDSSEESSRTDVSVKELEEKCHNQELEIAALKKVNSELEATLQSERLSRKNGVREEETSWYWDPPPQPSKDPTHYEQHIAALQNEISDLKQGTGKELARLHEEKKQNIEALRNEISNLKQNNDEELIRLRQENRNLHSYEQHVAALQNEISDLKQGTGEEITRLREENKNLTVSLEDLDSQHQLAMERLLTLKRELQKNFEVLKQEHEELKTSNDDYEAEKQVLLGKIGERDKEIEELKKHNFDYETLHHKYMNLEKVHSLLKENAEKFQEENQELHEEVFKLQEHVTKYEHELELATKHSEMSNMVPRESYEELMKELSDLKDQKSSNRVNFEETNIDDNAKSVIESLKREIRELKHKLSQKENENKHLDKNVIPSEKIMQLYNKYVNFELPIDYIGEMPSSDDNIVLFKLESSFKTLSSFKKDIDTLEHELAEKKHDINEMEVQIFDLTGENDFLSSDIVQFRSELKEMKKNNDFLINEIAALKNTSKLEPIIETHEENVAKLESELDDCNKINKNFESKIKIIQKELDEVKTEKVALQASLKEMRDKYTTMLHELETFKNQTRAIEDLAVDSKSENCNKLKRAVDEIDDLRKRVSTANAKNEQMAIDLHIIENDKVLLTKEVDDLKHALADTVAAHDSLQNVKITLDKKLSDLEIKLDEITKNKQEVEAHKAKLEENLLTFENKLKANESLSTELEKVTVEKQNLTDKLDKVMKENATLNETVEKITSEVLVLKQNETQLQTENNLLKSNIKVECVTQNDEILALREEITTLKEEKQHLIENKLKFEAELTSTDEKIVRLEEDFEKLLVELNEKDVIVDRLNATITENNSTITNLNDTVTCLNTTLDIKNQEIQKLTQSLNQTSSKINEITSISDRGFDELKQLENEKSDLNNQILSLNEEMEAKNSQISLLSNKTEELEKLCNEYKATIVSKGKEIKELNQSIVECTDKIKTSDDFSHLNDEYATLRKQKETVEKELTDLKNHLLTKEIELTDLRSKSDQFENTVFEYKNAIDAAAKEKNELINLINLKHNESIQYHNEIQRLNHVLLEQTNEYRRIVEEKENITRNKSDGCENCENLRMTLKEKDEIILNLNKNTTDLERLKTELSQANDTIISLKERCENLDKSLAIQLETVKRLTAEQTQLSEQEQNSTRELERLRQHLVEMEENYTQELMTSEMKLTECQTRLHQVEERAKQTSTVYTSNSIRANQEVETLRNQIKLLEKQREDVQTRLSEAEDARSRSEAALTNLQVVLEQFQLDKERDIHAATEKIQNKMADIKRQNLGLQDEISRLNAKLEEALAGLQAASRLGDQVETKTAQINDLKEQVRALQASVAAAEERYLNATSNQQDKVDKNLVKNLLINYVLTASQNPASKIQVLRILSTVLDFNQQECERLGLARSSAAPDSLAAEFVKFLQNESKPRTPLPNMMGIAQGPSRSTTPVSRKNSTLGPSPVIELGHQRNPSTGSNNLLFQNLDQVETSSQVSIESDTTKRTLETGVTQPRDTEGAILKHVLRDM